MLAILLRLIGGDARSKSADALLKDRLRKYKLSSDPPFTVCQMVSAIEARFDYPLWLGNLFRACDWCESHSSREDFAGVKEEAERLEKLL